MIVVLYYCCLVLLSLYHRGEATMSVQVVAATCILGGPRCIGGNFNIVKVDISEFIFLLLKEIFVVLKMHPDKSMIGSLGSF